MCIRDRLKNDDWGDSVNGTYDLHQWDFHCTIGVFRLTKKATVHSRLTPVELWDQKMLQIGVSHRKCNCCIKRVLDEEEVDWYKQWKICYGGDALTSARNTMMQCFPFNHHGPPGDQDFSCISLRIIRRGTTTVLPQVYARQQPIDSQQQ